jgi:hypothetical protein
MIRLSCPKCRKGLNIADKFAGKVGACPQCKTKVRVPDLEPDEVEVIEEVEEEIITDIVEDIEPEEETPRRDRIRGKIDKSEESRPRKSRSRDEEDEEDEDKPARRKRTRDEEEDDEPPRRPRSGKRRKKSRSQEGMSPLVKALIVMGGICLLSSIVSIFLNPAMFAPIILGMLMTAAGNIMFLIVAFSDDALQGLLCWLVPFYSLYYLITHFEEEKVPFLTSVGGLVMAMVGGIGGILGAALGHALGISIK